MKITCWADYACPYCYIGETALKQAVKNLKIERKVTLEMKAFELEPDGPLSFEAPTAERNAKKYGYPVEEIRRNIEEVNRRGQALGLDMHYDESRYTNTFNAHRLTKLAQSKEDESIADQLQERLFKAYFTDCLELADHDTLIKTAVESGLDEAEVRDVLLSEKYADEVRSDESEAFRRQIHAVPFFVINDEYAIPGALPTGQIEKILLKLLEIYR